jgi:hypothetical protein
MKPVATLLAALACSVITFAPQAEARPGGCLKYGAAGAVAGHYAGHHALKGAVLGCIAGVARRRQYDQQHRDLKAQQLKAQQQQAVQPQPDATRGAVGGGY